MSKAYSESFTSKAAVDSYYKKFTKKLHTIRHSIEVEIINKHAMGKLFDCSIGSGRFIEELEGVESYSGMDYSKEFVDRIKEKYPNVSVKQGDLLKGIDEIDQSFDTVICLRTMNNVADTIEKFMAVIEELVRITKSGGLLIFDYGRSGGIRYTDVPDLLMCFLVEIETIYGMDRLMPKISRNKRLKGFFNHKINIIPNSIWKLVDRSLFFFVKPERNLFIMRKHYVLIESPTKESVNRENIPPRELELSLPDMVRTLGLVPAGSS